MESPKYEQFASADSMRPTAAGEEKEWMSKQVKGTLIVIAGMVILTPDALLVRKLDNLQDMTMIFYRSLLFIGAVALILVLQHREKSWTEFIGMGKPGLAAGVLWGISCFCITYAFQTTAVGNVLVINAANPAFSAISSWLFMGEVIKTRTLLAACVCFAAIVVVFASTVGPDSGGIGGVFLALGSSVTLGGYFTAIRYIEYKYGYVPDAMAINIVAGIVTAIIAIIVAQGELDEATDLDWLWLFLDGALLLPVSFLALSIGPSMISAPEVSLITLLETALGPVWVYIGGYEQPSWFAIGGGIALMIALAWHSVLAMQDEHSVKDTEEVAEEQADDQMEVEMPAVGEQAVTVADQV